MPPPGGPVQGEVQPPSSEVRNGYPTPIPPPIRHIAQTVHFRPVDSYGSWICLSVGHHARTQPAQCLAMVRTLLADTADRAGIGSNSRKALANSEAALNATRNAGLGSVPRV